MSATGAEPGTRRTTCETCRGQGQVRFNQGFLTVARPCPKCQGAGEIVKDPCKSCRGEGRKRAEHLLSGWRRDVIGERLVEMANNRSGQS